MNKVEANNEAIVAASRKVVEAAIELMTISLDYSDKSVGNIAMDVHRSATMAYYEYIGMCVGVPASDCVPEEQGDDCNQMKLFGKMDVLFDIGCVACEEKFSYYGRDVSFQGDVPFVLCRSCHRMILHSYAHKSG